MPAASESARIEAANQQWRESTTPVQRASWDAANRAHVANTLSWVLYGNPNKPGGEQR